MVLKSLEIKGFKTFPEKTVLNFDKGISAVVGPNGSGKSNVSDAIRWVLGEQSVKNLRSSKMEDIIFNGSPKKKAASYAEVTLTIDNFDRALNFDNDLVSITRKYYRKGDSEYRINDITVRLKDIHELFMDTGLGRDGYSMISQGKIDSIVSASSEDRREIFEEAAGVSKIKYRKLESEKKLNSVEENLVRLKDILSELELRVGPLKKQSENAEQYILYNDKKEKLEIGMWLATLKKSSKELETFSKKIEEITSNNDKLDEDIEGIQKESDDIFKKINIYIKNTDEIRNEISGIDCKINDIKSDISIAENDILHNEEEIINVNKEIIENSKFLDNLDLDINEQENNLARLKNLLMEKEKQLIEKRKEISSLDENINKIDEKINNLNAEDKKLLDRISEQKLSGVTAQSSIEEINNRIKDNLLSKASKEEKVESYSKSLSDIKNNKEKNKISIEEITNKINGYKLSIESKQNKYNKCKENADHLYIDKEDLNRRVIMLEDLQKNLEGFSESVKIIMKEAKRENLNGIHGPVSKVISVEDKYTVAIDVALGQSIQNIIVDNEENAKNAINLLKNRKAGRATFLPISIIKGKAINRDSIKVGKGSIGIASELCRCSDIYRGIIDSLLGRILIVDNLNNALSIAKENNYRFRIVTLDGQVVNAGGSLTGGSHIQKLNVIGRSNEIEKLKKDMLRIGKELDNNREELKKYEEELSKLKTMEWELNVNLNEEKENGMNIDLSYKNIINNINLEKSFIDQIDKENEGLEARIKNFDDKIKESKSFLDKDVSLSEEIKIKLKESNSKKSELMSVYEALSKKIHDFEIELVSVRKEFDSENMKSEFLKGSYTDKDKKMNFLNERLNKLRQDNKDLSENVSSYEKELESCSKRKLELDNKISSNSSGRMELEKKSTELRNKEREFNSLKETIVRDLSRLEEKKDSLQKDYDSIITKLWEEYELTRKQAEMNYDEISDIQDGQKQVNDLKNKIKRLGAVNLDSIEEYKEVNERYTFMKAQIEDVDNSKRELTKLINELTNTMRNTFIDKFNMINERFKETFEELFGGGKASLELTVPDDYLNSGIKILVQPPGKIVSNMELLSGGEKALVAISLYFAIMKVSPSPFCVLDEIEAALDDVNVDRFASYLSKMSDQTQFIVITHRRGTMEEADVLYGVTMQEEGISNLLKLDVSEIEKIDNAS